MLNLKKILSVKNIVNELINTFLRFPFAIISGIAATFSVFHVIDLDYNQLNENQYWYNIIQTLFLGISLFTAISLFLEKIEVKGIKNLLIKVGAGLLLAGYYFTLPETYHLKSLINGLLLAIVFHLLVSFIPYYKKEQMNGFWQFNKSLFLRFFFGGIYSGVLYVGLALAMAAIQHLFNVDIDGDYYAKLWFFIIGVFNTWFFLAGVPSNFEILDDDNSYPKGLKIFTQYVLLSIVSVYLLILYLYMIKIIVQGEWPVGWVSNLVLGFSITGIFSLLLIYPVINRKESAFTSIFAKLYFWVLIPLITMLFMAIWVRIGEYGITENRYFVLILALWLAGITIFMLFNKFKNIKIIPISLAIIAFLSLYGPWSAFNVSMQSQISRLENLLEQNQMLKVGKAEKLKGEISFDDNKNICSIVEYIVDYHGYDELQYLFTTDLDTLLKEDRYAYNQSYAMITKELGLKYLNRWQTEEYENKYFSFNAYNLSESNLSFDIKAYDYYLFFQKQYNYSNTDSIFNKKYKIDDSELSVSYNNKTLSIDVSVNDSCKISLPIKERIIELKKMQDVKELTFDDMLLKAENNDLQLFVLLNNINGNIENQDSIIVNNFEAQMFLDIKE